MAPGPDFPIPIIRIILPVTICAIYCCVVIRILSKNLSPTEPNLLDSTWQQLGLGVKGDVVADTSSVTNLTSYLVIVAIFITMIVTVTLFILFIFYMQWQQCLIYYFYLPSAIILTILTPTFLRTICQALNMFAIDIYTLILMTWNFAALGMMSIFGLYAPGPLCLQQFYLIHNSVILSVLIIHALPGWAPWLLLIFLVLWDLFAVLAPYGPLNLILNLAEREGIVEMPGLIYSTDTPMVSKSSESRGILRRASAKRSRFSDGAKRLETILERPTKDAADDQKAKTTELITIKSEEPTKKSTDTATSSSKEAKQTAENGDQKDKNVIADAAEKEVMEEEGVSIGLGDFIFYSLLTGLASKGREQSDFYTVLTTLNSILFGLILTLITLALSKRALPALPFSIGLGLTVAALTIQFVPPLSNALASQAIFV